MCFFHYYIITLYSSLLYLNEHPSMQAWLTSPTKKSKNRDANCLRILKHKIISR